LERPSVANAAREVCSAAGLDSPTVDCLANRLCPLNELPGKGPTRGLAIEWLMRDPINGCDTICDRDPMNGCDPICDPPTKGALAPPPQPWPPKWPPPKWEPPKWAPPPPPKWPPPKPPLKWAPPPPPPNLAEAGTHGTMIAKRKTAAAPIRLSMTETLDTR
jgi:hypothetical protein